MVGVVREAIAYNVRWCMCGSTKKVVAKRQFEYENVKAERACN